MIRTTLLFPLLLLSCFSQVSRSNSLPLLPNGTIAFIAFVASDNGNPPVSYPDIAGEFIDSFNACLLRAPLRVIDRSTVATTFASNSLPLTEPTSPEALTAMASALNADYLIFGTGRTERVLWDRFLRTASFRVIEAKSGTIVLAGSAEQLNSHATWVGNKLGCETADELNKKSSK